MTPLIIFLLLLLLLHPPTTSSTPAPETFISHILPHPPLSLLLHPPHYYLLSPPTLLKRASTHQTVWLRHLPPAPPAPIPIALFRRHSLLLISQNATSLTLHTLSTSTGRHLDTHVLYTTPATLSINATLDTPTALLLAGYITRPTDPADAFLLSIHPRTYAVTASIVPLQHANCISSLAYHPKTRTIYALITTHLIPDTPASTSTSALYTFSPALAPTPFRTPPSHAPLLTTLLLPPPHTALYLLSRSPVHLHSLSLRTHTFLWTLYLGTHRINTPLLLSHTAAHILATGHTTAMYQSPASNTTLLSLPLAAVSPSGKLLISWPRLVPYPGAAEHLTALHAHDPLLYTGVYNGTRGTVGSFDMHTFSQTPPPERLPLFQRAAVSPRALKHAHRNEVERPVSPALVAACVVLAVAIVAVAVVVWFRDCVLARRQIAFGEGCGGEERGGKDGKDGKVGALEEGDEADFSEGTVGGSCIPV